MNILVTGHLGYIGTILTPMLQGRGHTVAGLDTDLYSRCTFGDPSKIADVPNIAKDIRDVTAADLDGFDCVLHLAGLSNDPLGNLNPDLTFDINHKATVHLATMAKKAGVKRFVFSSSCSNYGASGDNMLDETAAFNPVTPYGKSKVLAEQDVAPLGDENFCPVFLRSSTAYGVSPRLRFDLVLNNLVAFAMTTGEVLLKSDGTPWRPIVHIEDISRAFTAVAEAPRDKVFNDCFNVGRTDQNFQMKELADIVAETVPNVKVVIAEGAGPDLRCYRVSCDKLPNTIPDFKPQWDARKGAQEIYEAYKGIDLTLEEFEGPRYQRIGHIKKLLADGVIDTSLRHTTNAA